MWVWGSGFRVSCSGTNRSELVASTWDLGFGLGQDRSRVGHKNLEFRSHLGFWVPGFGFGKDRCGISRDDLEYHHLLLARASVACFGVGFWFLKFGFWSMVYGLWFMVYGL